jgi:predicted adenylyl cyclase CyaB
MPRNIEIKASVEHLDGIENKVALIATEDPTTIAQDDTFFRCDSGRLKLRAFSDTEGELIFYRRADENGPKESFYLCSPTTAPATLRESLSLAYGQMGRVQKQRIVYIVGRARVHLDKVKDLGYFIEIEVVLTEEESAESGQSEAYELMEYLGIKPSQLVKGAYVDLINQSDG